MAAKPRVHEIATELGVDSKVALAKLKEMGEFVKGPSSSVEPPVARRLRAALEADGVKTAAAGAKTEAPVAAKPASASTAKPGARPAPAKPAAQPVAVVEAPAAAAVDAPPLPAAPLTVAERQAQAAEKAAAAGKAAEKDVAAEATTGTIYFNNGAKRPPLEARARLDANLKRLADDRNLTYAQRYQFNMLVSRFTSYRELWRRLLKKRGEESV